MDSGYQTVQTQDVSPDAPLGRDSKPSPSTSHVAASQLAHEPRTLHKPLWSRFLQALLDMLIVSTGVLFIAFGCLVYTHDGAAYESGSGSTADRLIQLSQYNSTIFPLLFAALVGGALKNMATWRVQERASLSLLQQLMGSQTISGTFLTQIQLRAFNLLGLLLIILWSLSPLGSQASSRVIFIETAYNATRTNLATIPAFAASIILQDTGSSFSSESWAYVAAPWLASIASYTLLSNRNQDLWNNLRLPLIERLTDRPDESDAITLTNITGITYSSLVGFPLTTLPATGNTSFTLSGSYMNVDCPVLQNVSKLTNYTNASPGHDTDCTWATLAGSPLFQVVISQPCSASLNISSGGDRDARRLIYETIGTSPTDDQWLHVECTLSTTYVDTLFDCSGSPPACVPMRMQRSINPPHSSNWTILDQAGGHIPAEQLGTLIGSSFPPAGIEGTQPPLMTYLQNPGSSMQDTYAYSADKTAQARNTKEDYADRIAQLINSIFMLSVLPGSILGGFSTDLSFPDGDFQHITGMNTVGYDVIRCSHGWLGMLFVASLIMCIVKIAGTALRFVTLVPDVLGSVALAMLPNQFRRLQGQSTTQSGVSWAKNLRGLEVRLGDVEPSADVGRVALAALVDETSIGRVEKGRYYYQVAQADCDWR
ncbi:hypothetical protein GGI42DRAFT_364644 [Trichoderma sp. SZMC 28013]